MAKPQDKKEVTCVLHEAWDIQEIEILIDNK